ncbi:MAG: histidine--tRNA ligase [Candidatus Angelobacter sp.]
MRDFLPDEKEFRERAISAIRNTYAAFGYREIETPALEELSRLTAGQGGDNEKMLFTVLRRGLDSTEPIKPADAVDLGLRFDLTLPLARFVASNSGALTDVTRVIQIAPVWRAERPQKGRYRQFTQCDIDVIGESGIIAEVELIVATVTTLKNLGIADSYVRLNDREILYGMLEGCGFSSDLYDRSLIVVDKLDKIGSEAVITELIEKVGIEDSKATQLGELLQRFESIADKSDFKAVSQHLPQTVSSDAIAKAVAIRDAVISADPTIIVQFDISLVRGMGYYTGPIFELSHPSLKSSIAGGGRYDKMIGRFANRDIPACGFSIGFERIMDLISLAPVEYQKVVVLYDADLDAGSLVRQQKMLVERGYSVRLVRQPKRVGAMLDKLRDEGFSYYAYANAASAEDNLELRNLSTESVH